MEFLSLVKRQDFEKQIVLYQVEKSEFFTGLKFGNISFRTHQMLLLGRQASCLVGVLLGSPDLPAPWLHRFESLLAAQLANQTGGMPPRETGRLTENQAGQPS